MNRAVSVSGPVSRLLSTSSTGNQQDGADTDEQRPDQAGHEQLRRDTGLAVADATHRPPGRGCSWAVNRRFRSGRPGRPGPAGPPSACGRRSPGRPVAGRSKDGNAKSARHTPFDEEIVRVIQRSASEAVGAVPHSVQHYCGSAATLRPPSACASTTTVDRASGRTAPMRRS